MPAIGTTTFSDRLRIIWKMPPCHACGVVPTTARRLAHAGVDGIKQSGQVADDAADQQSFQPFRDFIPDEIQRTSLLKNPLPLSSGSG